MECTVFHVKKKSWKSLNKINTFLLLAYAFPLLIKTIKFSQLSAVGGGHGVESWAAASPTCPWFQASSEDLQGEFRAAASPA